MDTQQFIENFEYITSAPNGASELKKLILRLAIQGRLTRQIEDESVKKLFARIDNEKLGKSADLKMRSYKPEKKNFQKPFNIPAGWEWECLESITQINMGQSPDSSTVNDFGEGIPFYQGKSEFGEIFPTPRRWCTNPKKVANEGDVLISVRAPVGPTNLCPETSCIGRGLAAIQPLGGILSYYILYGLRALEDIFEGMGTGSTFAAISSRDLQKFLFPVPPIEEQKRIVAKIEKLLALCDRFKEQQSQFTKVQTKANSTLINNLYRGDTSSKLEASWNKLEANFSDLLNTRNNVESLKETIKTLAVLGKLETSSNKGNFQKIIAESIEQKKSLLASKEIMKRKLLPSLTPDEIRYDYSSHWPVARFDDLANITGGVTKGRRFRGRQTLNYPYLRVANVQRGYFLLDDVKEIEIPIDEYEKYVLMNGDILITEGGDWDKVGRTAIWKGQLQDCLHQNHIFKARMFSGHIEKEWIELVFNSSIGRQYWASASKQTTNLASINMTQVRSFPVPIPPQEEQQRILHKLNSLLSICDRLLETIEESQEVQKEFLKAAIYSILHNDVSKKIMVKEKDKMKQIERQISVNILLASSIVDGPINTTLAKILKDNNGKMEAKELWQASKIKDIDKFYALLKQEIEDGLIQEPDIAEFKLVEMIE